MGCCRSFRWIYLKLKLRKNVVIILFKCFTAFKDGHPDDIFVPFDSKNRLCGVDEEVKDKPYLFYFDLTQCFPDKPGETPICNTPQVKY